MKSFFFLRFALESVHVQGKYRETEKEPQANSPVSMLLHRGQDAIILKSRPEPKPRFGPLTS